MQQPFGDRANSFVVIIQSSNQFLVRGQVASMAPIQVTSEEVQGIATDRSIDVFWGMLNVKDADIFRRDISLCDHSDLPIKLQRMVPRQNRGQTGDGNYCS